MIIKNDERHIAGIRFNMFGTTDITTTKNAKNLITALESETTFSPTSASRDERRNQSYDRDWLLQTATHPEREYENYIYFKRQKASKYTGYFITGKKPYLGININPKLAEKNHHSLNNWCQSLVDAFSPDYAVLTIFANCADAPWPTTLDERICRFRYSSLPFPGGYYRSGPRGLGTITWIGKHFIDQIGSKNIEKFENSTSIQQDWSGMKIVFGNIDEPWNMEMEEFLNHWEKASEEYSRHEIFSSFYLNSNGAFRVKKGERCLIGGVVDEFSLDKKN